MYLTTRYGFVVLLGNPKNGHRLSFLFAIFEGQPKQVGTEPEKTSWNVWFMHQAWFIHPWRKWMSTGLVEVVEKVTLVTKDSPLRS